MMASRFSDTVFVAGHWGWMGQQEKGGQLWYTSQRPLGNQVGNNDPLLLLRTSSFIPGDLNWSLEVSEAHLYLE